MNAIAKIPCHRQSACSARICQRSCPAYPVARQSPHADYPLRVAREHFAAVRQQRGGFLTDLSAAIAIGSAIGLAFYCSLAGCLALFTSWW
jgi:hypothetical protein